MLKLFGESVKVNGREFAVVVNEKTKEAFEAVMNESGKWEIDFNCAAMGIDSIDVAAAGLPYDEAREAGYFFPDEN